MVSGVGMKIRIVGIPGSGKTWLAARLGVALGMHPVGLDDLFWHNGPGAYNRKRDAAGRQALLEAALAGESWLVEGMDADWSAASLVAADVVIWLRIGVLTSSWRLARRFVRRKAGIEESTYDEKLYSLLVTMWGNLWGKLRGAQPDLPGGAHILVLRNQKEVGRFLSAHVAAGVLCLICRKASEKR